MYEKCNPSHPDKVADRIAGAIVDLAYTKNENPKVAVEVLIGHSRCFIINETSEHFEQWEIAEIVKRITKDDAMYVVYNEYQQDSHLAKNQAQGVRCGDNGIFKGVPVTEEQKKLSDMARRLYEEYPVDGKFVVDHMKLIACQSNAKNEDLADWFVKKTNYMIRAINPLGEWTGGLDVDSGATNRKLGSDMGDAVTGGGLHGKDLSKADVSVNIYAHLKAQKLGKEVTLCCAIGDDMVDGRPYSEIVEIAREYIRERGGFEKFAEWGLI